MLQPQQTVTSILSSLQTTWWRGTQLPHSEPPAFLFPLPVSSGQVTCLHRGNFPSPSPENLLICPSGAMCGQHPSNVFWVTQDTNE